MDCDALKRIFRLFSHIAQKNRFRNFSKNGKFGIRRTRNGFRQRNSWNLMPMEKQAMSDIPSDRFPNADTISKSLTENS